MNLGLKSKSWTEHFGCTKEKFYSPFPSFTRHLQFNCLLVNFQSMKKMVFETGDKNASIFNDYVVKQAQVKQTVLNIMMKRKS